MYCTYMLPFHRSSEVACMSDFNQLRLHLGNVISYRSAVKAVCLEIVLVCQSNCKPPAFHRERLLNGLPFFSHL